ncbi:MAG: WD40/YVTN/BNR-like repeat-containing protein [Myxococcota bacterium]
MRVFPLLLLAACSGKGFTLDTGDTADTGIPECGRIRGTEGVLMYQEGGNTVRSPLETPDDHSVTTGVAGPLGDDRTYLAAIDGVAHRTVDGGCNWERVGTLPSGTWRLYGAGSRVYAFDADSASGARSDDGGGTWTAFETGERFVGQPVVDASNPDRVRGLQTRGVVTSTDGGDTWEVGNVLPSGLGAPQDGDLLSSALDTAVVGGSNGAWRTTDAGATWAPVMPEVSVTAVAIHPDDGAVIFAQSSEDGVRTISRSADGGGTWARQVDSAQVDLGDEPHLWPVLGNTSKALATKGFVHNTNTDSDGVNLYVITAGEGTRTVFVGTWYHIHQVAFGEDRWMAAVDAVAGR